MKLLKAFGIDFALYGTSKVLVALAGITSIAVLTSRLAPSDFGVFWQIFTLTTGAATIATTGPVTAFRRYYGQFIAEGNFDVYRRAAAGAVYRCLGVSVIMFLPVLFVAALIGGWELGPLRGLAATFAFGASTCFLLSCGHMMAARKTVTFLLASAAQAVMFLLLSYGVLPLAGGDLVACALLLLAASYALGVPDYSLFRATALEAGDAVEVNRWTREFLVFGLPLIVMNCALLLSNLGTQMVIAAISGTQEAGIYAAYSAPIDRLIGFSASIAAMAFLPVVSTQWDRQPKSESLRFLFAVIAIVTAASVTVSVLLICFGGVFLGLLVDERYAAGAALIPILCVAATASAIAAILADVLILQKRTFQLAGIFSLATAAGLVVSIALAVSGGAQGAATGRLVSGAVTCLLIAWAIKSAFGGEQLGRDGSS